LLIEDHEPLAEATAELMHEYGFEVKIASTGHQALEMSLTFEPEIVLCDLRLPDMKGLDVARALRALPGGTNLVIAVHSLMYDRSGHQRTGPATALVDRIVPKPITRETLDDLVAQLESKGLRHKSSRVGARKTDGRGIRGESQEDIKS
jgi:CheY-like chemotaxis protein